MVYMLIANSFLYPYHPVSYHIISYHMIEIRSDFKFIFTSDPGTVSLKVHKHENFFLTFFAETEILWSQGPVTRDF
jgi:hypothetical protein